MIAKTSLFTAGDCYELTRAISPELMDAFRALSGDDNPVHRDEAYACQHGFRGPIAYGNIFGAMLSRLVGCELPTREVIILRQTLEFRQPAYVGQEVALTAEVVATHEAVLTVLLNLRFRCGQDLLCTGQCLIKCL